MGIAGAARGKLAKAVGPSRDPSLGGWALSPGAIDRAARRHRSLIHRADKVLEGTGVGLVAAAVAIAQSAPTVRWHRAMTFPSIRFMAPARSSASNLADVSDQTFLVPVFGPGEVVPAFQGVRRRLGGHGGNGQHRLQLLHRHGSLLCLRRRRAVRPQRAADERLADLRLAASTCSMIFTRPITSTACRSAIRPRRWGWLRKEVKNRR
jgi:hypothetical protein